MIIRHGGMYRTRDGQEFTARRHPVDGSGYQFEVLEGGERMFFWTDEGTYYVDGRPHELDAVAEMPEIGGTDVCMAADSGSARGPRMTRSEYMDFHSAACAEMFATCKKKNADYTGGAAEADDPFANFRAAERLGVTTTEAGMLVRMLDKFARVSSFIKRGVLEVSDESVRDTLLDLANYSILLAGVIAERRRMEGEK